MIISFIKYTLSFYLTSTSVCIFGEMWEVEDERELIWQASRMTEFLGGGWVVN